MAALDQIGESVGPVPGTTIRLSGARGFRVVGWAVDASHQAAALAVDVAIDGTAYASVYGTNRRDVADYFKQPAYWSSGFTADIPAGSLVKGLHSLSLRVVSSDGACYAEVSPIGLMVD